MTTEEKRAEIRRLNDRLRCSGIGGRRLITAGIAALGSDRVSEVLPAVARFDAFTEDNDPYDEHDCATLGVGGIRVLWKIDYYDLTLTRHSPDPSDPNVTIRVITVMLASEY